jgi:hypothetical protein
MDSRKLWNLFGKHIQRPQSTMPLTQALVHGGHRDLRRQIWRSIQGDDGYTYEGNFSGSIRWLGFKNLQDHGQARRQLWRHRPLRLTLRVARNRSFLITKWDRGLDPWSELVKSIKCVTRYLRVTGTTAVGIGEYRSSGALWSFKNELTVGNCGNRMVSTPTECNVTHISSC